MSSEQIEHDSDESGKSSKKVRFAGGTKETDAARMKRGGFFAQRQISTQKISGYEDLLKLWLHNSRENFSNPGGSADNLRRLLDSKGLADRTNMVSFLQRKGGLGTLLWPLNMLKSPQHLRFVCDYVPRDLLQELLRKDNYYAADHFLRLGSSAEKRGKFIDERRQESFEKAKILLEVDYEGLVAYSRSEVFQKYRPAVQVCFLQAIEEYKIEHGLDTVRDCK